MHLSPVGFYVFCHGVSITKVPLWAAGTTKYSQNMLLNIASKNGPQSERYPESVNRPGIYECGAGGGESYSGVSVIFARIKS